MSMKKKFLDTFYPNGIQTSKKEIAVIKTALEISVKNTNEKELLDFKKSFL